MFRLEKTRPDVRRVFSRSQRPMNDANRPHTRSSPANRYRSRIKATGRVAGDVPASATRFVIAVPLMRRALLHAWFRFADTDRYSRYDVGVGREVRPPERSTVREARITPVCASRVRYAPSSHIPR